MARATTVDVLLPTASPTFPGASSSRLSLASSRVEADSSRITADSFQLTPDSFQLTPDSLQLTPDSFQLTPDSFQLTPDSFQLTPDEAAPIPAAAPILDTGPSPAALPRQRPPLLLLACLLAVYFLWGSTYLAIRVALETIPPFSLGALRFLIAGGGLYTVLRLRGAPRPSPREWRTAIVTGFLLFVCGNGFVVLGEQWVSSGLVALVVGTMPLWAAMFAGATGQRSSGREWFGLALGFLGISVLSLGGELSAAGYGALLVLLAPVCWALGVVIGRRGPLPAGAMAAASQMLAGGVAMLAITLVRGETLTELPSGRSLLAMAHLVISGSLVGFTAYGYLLRNTRTAVANSYAYVNPIVAIILGSALAGEPVGPTTWIAAAIILSGVALLGLARPAK